MKNYWEQNENNIYVAAHRGFSEKYPENTMAAFRAALEFDVDQIETDVRVTADGELVLIHDETAERTTDGKGKICEMTLAEVKKLDAGIKKAPEFAGERVPTLRELMELVRLMRRAQEYLRFNVSSKHIFGLLSVRSIN
jgi:glycerophosphoryl diester phosphodiesterase